MTYHNINSFFWNTRLSEERRKEILNWVSSLDKKEESFLEDLIRDTMDEAEYNAEMSH